MARNHARIALALAQSDIDPSRAALLICDLYNAGYHHKNHILDYHDIEGAGLTLPEYAIQWINARLCGDTIIAYKSRRTITPEQHAAMTAARMAKKPR